MRAEKKMMVGRTEKAMKAPVFAQPVCMWGRTGAILSAVGSMGVPTGTLL